MLLLDLKSILTHCAHLSLCVLFISDPSTFWIHPPLCVWCPFLFVVVDKCYMNLTSTNSKWGQLESFFRCVLKRNCIIFADKYWYFLQICSYIYVCVFLIDFLNYRLLCLLKNFHINIKCCKIWAKFGSIEIDFTKTFSSFTSTWGDWKCWSIINFFSLVHRSKHLWRKLVYVFIFHKPLSTSPKLINWLPPHTLH